MQQDLRDSSSHETILADVFSADAPLLEVEPGTEEGQALEDLYERLRCIGKIDLTDHGTRELAREKIQSICAEENESGLRKRLEFLDDLELKLDEGEFGSALANGELSAEKLRQYIYLVRGMFHDIAAKLAPPEAPFPVEEKLICTMPVRILGPIDSLGANITCTLSQAAVEHAVREAVKQTGERISGYFLARGDGNTEYHISRVPRRVELPIPPYEAIGPVLGVLCAELAKQTESVKVYMDGKAQEIRAVIGLEEGYFEERSFSRRHSIDDVRKLLDGSSFTVLEADIYTCAPSPLGAGLTEYREPAVVVLGKTGEFPPLVLLKLADRFHQARFSLEDRRDLEAYNVEILAFSQSRSACDNSTI